MIGACMALLQSPLGKTLFNELYNAFESVTTVASGS